MKLNAYAGVEELSRLGDLADMEKWVILENVDTGKRIEGWDLEAWTKASESGQWKLIKEELRYKETTTDKIGGGLTTLFNLWSQAQPKTEPVDAIQYTPGVPGAGGGGGTGTGGKMGGANLAIIGGIGLVTVLGIYFLTRK